MRISAARFSALVFLVLSFVVNHAYADGERSSSLQVSPAALTLAVGETARLTTTNSVGSLRVRSSAPAVATVSYANRRITVQGVRAGTAIVTVSDSSASRDVTVTVTGPSSAALTVSPAFVSLSVGATAGLSVANAVGTVTVASSDVAVATVSYAGSTVTVRGAKAGSAAVTVRDSKASAIAQILVVNGPVVSLNGYALLAWNDLGMHCIDGKDYSVFSILPPYNNLHAQLVNKTTGKQVTTGVTLTTKRSPTTRCPAPIRRTTRSTPSARARPTSGRTCSRCSVPILRRTWV